MPPRVNHVRRDRRARGDPPAPRRWASLLVVAPPIARKSKPATTTAAVPAVSSSLDAQVGDRQADGGEARRRDGRAHRRECEAVDAALELHRAGEHAGDLHGLSRSRNTCSGRPSWPAGGTSSTMRSGRAISDLRSAPAPVRSWIPALVQWRNESGVETGSCVLRAEKVSPGGRLGAGAGGRPATGARVLRRPGKCLSCVRRHDLRLSRCAAALATNTADLNEALRSVERATRSRPLTAARQLRDHRHGRPGGSRDDALLIQIDCNGAIALDEGATDLVIEMLEQARVNLGQRRQRGRRGGGARRAR